MPERNVGQHPTFPLSVYDESDDDMARNPYKRQVLQHLKKPLRKPRRSHQNLSGCPTCPPGSLMPGTCHHGISQNVEHNMIPPSTWHCHVLRGYVQHSMILHYCTSLLASAPPRSRRARRAARLEVARPRGKAGHGHGARSRCPRHHVSGSDFERSGNSNLESIMNRLVMYHKHSVFSTVVLNKRSPAIQKNPKKTSKNN